MKENTKFLWMYVGILFSFALILIIFAGLSQSTDSEQTLGLKNDITTLSQKNTELQAQNKELDSVILNLTAERDALKAECDALKLDAEKKRVTDEALMNALEAFNKGQRTKSQQIIKTIDSKSLTEAQLYIYNRLIG